MTHLHLIHPLPRCVPVTTRYVRPLSPLWGVALAAVLGAVVGVWVWGMW